MKTMKEIRISRWGQACESRGDKRKKKSLPSSTWHFRNWFISLFLWGKATAENNLQLIFLLRNFIIVPNSYLFWQFDEEIVLVSYSSCGYHWAPSSAPQHVPTRCAVLLLRWAAQALVGTGASSQHWFSPKEDEGLYKEEGRWERPQGRTAAGCSWDTNRSIHLSVLMKERDS